VRVFLEFELCFWVEVQLIAVCDMLGILLHGLGLGKVGFVFLGRGRGSGSFRADDGHGMVWFVRDHGLDLWPWLKMWQSHGCEGVGGSRR
jgi:hypothetical protein